MDIINLLWIIPLSMLAGAILMACIACVVAGKITEEEEEKIRKILEESKNDNGNA